MTPRRTVTPRRSGQRGASIWSWAPDSRWEEERECSREYREDNAQKGLRHDGVRMGADCRGSPVQKMS